MKVLLTFPHVSKIVTFFSRIQPGASNKKLSAFHGGEDKTQSYIDVVRSQTLGRNAWRFLLRLLNDFRSELC